MQKFKQYLENKNINKKPSGNARQDYEYARDVIKGRWKEAEPIIMKDPYYAYLYAYYVIKGRWPEAEPTIIKSPYHANQYARYVIKNRLPEAEQYIVKDPQIAYLYAYDVIRDKWPEAEPTIMKDPDYSYLYAKNIIKGRWPKAEKYIAKFTNRIKEYLDLLSDNEKIEFLKLYPYAIKYVTVSREIKRQLPGLVIAKKTGLLGLQNAEI